jgi:tetratricopeptide (TPR) repeat protein
MKQIIYKLCLFVVIMLSINAASQPITITIKANYSNTVTIYHDEPLLLTVSLTNKEAQENSRWNKAADRRLNELEDLLKENKISKEVYDKERNALLGGKRSLEFATVGEMGKPWSSMIKWKLINTNSGTEDKLNVRKMVNPSSEDVAVLNDKGYYTAYFGLDVEEMKKIAAGTYEIIAEIENEKSKPVEVTLKNETMPAAIAGNEEMLLKNGQYYWHAGDVEQGMSYANKLLKRNPASVDGLSLKGDLQVMTNSYQPALESYNMALKEFYKQNPGLTEPPEYLLGMIEWLKGQK